MSDDIQFAGLEDIEGMTDGYSVCRIELPGGKVKRFKLGHLAYSEYNEIVLSVLDPVVPNTRLDPVTEKKVANPDDVTYKAKRAQAEEERRRRLLAASLEAGGMTLPGASLADKAERIGGWSTPIVAALLMGFTQAHHGMAGRLEDASNSFLGLSGANAAGAPELATDAE